MRHNPAFVPDPAAAARVATALEVGFMSCESIGKLGSVVSRRVAAAAAVGAMFVCGPAGLGAEEPVSPPVTIAAEVDPGIAWKTYHPSAFRRAFAEDRLVLLVLEVPWSESVARANREVWSAPAVVNAVKRGFVAIRERADLRPDLRRRYPAEGWPGVSILLPDGSPLVYQGPGAEATRRITSGFRSASQMVSLLEMAEAYVSSSRETAIAASRELTGTMKDTSKPEAGGIEEPMVWGSGTSLEGTFDP
ncbi:MAG: DUF255 domain-containing protein, partial [Acidobacteriota bacterium]|nr:DUF255 domain-containing protein [Acidobacteriota bacterium]